MLFAGLHQGVEHISCCRQRNMELPSELAAIGYAQRAHGVPGDLDLAHMGKREALIGAIIRGDGLQHIA